MTGFTAADVTAALGRPPEGAGLPDLAFRKVAIDSRQVRPGDLFVALRGERFDGHAFLPAAIAAGAAGAIGEARTHAGLAELPFWTVPDGRRALQALAGWHRGRLAVKVVGITGSNGKTTTKELVASVLSQEWRTARTEGNLNNQVGVPLTLLALEPSDEWAVVEMGMSLPGEIAPLAAIAAPQVAVVTNVAASHLEGLGSLAAVLEEKMSIARALEPDGLLVYCGDQPALREAAAALPCRTLAYGLDPSNDLAPEAWALDEDGRGRFVLGGRTFRLRLAGRHNVVNALAAVAVGREAGLADGRIAIGLAEPDALPLRMQLERWGDVVALVDCYNANPESVVSAAETLAGLPARRRLAVLGTMLELGAESDALHREVGRAVAERVDVVVAVGPGAAPLADGAGAAALRFPDSAAAVDWLVGRLRPGDAILFKGSRGAAIETVVGPVRAACLEGVAAGGGR